jgi:hypothetical protein
MKNKRFLLDLSGCSVWICLSTPGCDIHGIDTESRAEKTAGAGDAEYNPVAALQSAPDASKVANTYKKIVGLQLDYAQKGVEAVSEYINIPVQTINRSAASGTVDFESIGNLLPDDLSTLRRIKPALDRNAGGEDITLEEELNILIEDFSAELEAALPDPEKALTLDFVEGTDEGLLIGGDAIIPYLCFWEQKNSAVYGTFDFDSVMLYSGLTIKKVPTGNKTLKTKTPYNTDLSYWDVETVRRIY